MTWWVFLRCIVGIFFLFSMPFSVYSENQGEKIYQAACRNCHAPNLAQAVKAPSAFDKKVWDARFKAASEEAKKNPTRYKDAIHYLLSHLKMGKGLMYHGGLCHESKMSKQDCSDQSLIDAILYMSQHKLINQREKT